MHFRNTIPIYRGVQYVLNHFGGMVQHQTLFQSERFQQSFKTSQSPALIAKAHERLAIYQGKRTTMKRVSYNIFGISNPI